MWSFAIPALQAVGINAGVNLLRGKPLLSNAGTAAITGGTFGGSNSLLGQTDFGKSIFGAPVGSSITSGAKAIPQSAAQFEQSMGLPSSAFYAAGGQGMTGANTLASMGLSQTPYGTSIDPSSYLNIFGNPIYKGGEGLLSNAYSNVKEYITPQNLMGVANVLSSYQPPQQTAAPSPSSSIRQGNTQGLTVNYGMAQPIKRRGYA